MDIYKNVPPFSSGDMCSEGASTFYKPDLVMPGVNIPTCKPGGAIVLVSGTSEASPMLAGLAALLLESNPGMNAGELRRALLDCCIDLPAPPNRDGKGLPDADRLPISRQPET